MSKDHDDELNLMNRATLIARLEMVAEELDVATRRLAVIVEEIKTRNVNGGADDGTGVDGAGP